MWLSYTHGGGTVIYRAKQPHFLGLRQGAIVYLTGMPAGACYGLWYGWPYQLEERDRLAAQIPSDEAEAAIYSMKKSSPWRRCAMPLPVLLKRPFTRHFSKRRQNGI